ncbi:MAG: response regulator [Saprospiraceae bacterium]|nr:response regulator [Saprospiraceae bacterium]
MQSIKVLIVEDQKLIARDIESLLTDWGYNVIGCAVSGVEALALFNAHKPDLALVDIHIHGDMDGIDTVFQFNAIRLIPIVYLTAQADVNTVSRAKKSNPSAYLLKPFDERGLQISLEMAFNAFSKSQDVPPQYKSVQATESSKMPIANDIKLGADVILQIDNAIFIKQNYRFVKLNKDDLILLEADRNHTYIQTKQHRYIVRMPLTTVIERLQCNKLVRVHRSFGINIQHIEEFNDSEIIVAGKVIPFSAAYRDEFLKKFYLI